MKIQDLFNLKNKVAVITGATGYLGTSISEALAESGADVYITSKDEKKCEKIASMLAKNSQGEVEGLAMDILSEKSIKNTISEIEKKSGQIDILINNASPIPSNEDLLQVTDSEWKLGMDGTINGVFRCIKEISPIMERNNNGSIINIASMYGLVSPDPNLYKDTSNFNPPYYGPGKAAIIQFTKYAACYLAKKGIRVNSVSPGPFPNPIVQQDVNFINKLEKKTPLGRIGQPYELKGVIAFLASNASSYVTGENISVDGGWTAW